MAADLGRNPHRIAPGPSLCSQGQLIKEAGCSHAVLLTVEDPCGKKQCPRESRPLHNGSRPRSKDARAGLISRYSHPPSACLLWLLSKITLEVFCKIKVRARTNWTPPPFKVGCFWKSSPADFNTELDVLQKVSLKIFLTNPSPWPGIAPLKSERRPFYHAAVAVLDPVSLHPSPHKAALTECWLVSYA